MIYGLDVLGLAKYPDIIKHWPSGYACGVFDTEFGDVYKTVTKLLALGKCPLLRVQLLWGGREHTYGDKNIPTIKKRCPLYEKLKQKYPNVIIEISPFCEHRIRDNIDQYLDIVKQYAPSCVPVNNPWTGNLSRKYKNEVHGPKAKAPRGRFNLSYDGFSSNQDPNIEELKARMKNVEVFFMWTSAFNGLPKDTPEDPKKGHPPISQRWNWATKEHLEAMKFLTGKKDG